MAVLQAMGSLAAIWNGLGPYVVAAATRGGLPLVVNDSRVSAVSDSLLAAVRDSLLAPASPPVAEAVDCMLNLNKD